MKVLKGLFVPLLILMAWFFTSYFQLSNPYIIPSPGRVMETAWGLMQSGALLRHILASLSRVFTGFAIAFAAAFPLAVIIGMNRRLEDYCEPVLEFIRHIPPIACIPMLILWLGIGEASKIAVIILATFFPVFMNTLSGVVNCDVKLLEVGEVFAFTPCAKFFRIVLPSIVPSVIVGARLGLGYSWRSLIAAELIAASSGIGYMIMDAEQLSRPDIIIVGILSVGILGYLIDHVFFQLTRRLLPWHRKDVDYGRD